MKYTLWFILFLFIASACSDKVDVEDSQAETFNKLYGNSGNDRGCEIKELPNGDFLILATVQTASKPAEIVLIRTDRFGNEQWTKPLGGNAVAEAGGMDIHANGNIIVVGTTFNPGTTEEDSNHSDIIVIELDAAGNLLDEKVFDQFLDNEEGNCIAYDFTEIGGYIVGGSSDALFTYTESGDDFDNFKFIKNLFFIRVYEENGSETINPTWAGYRDDDFATNVTRSYWDGGNNFIFSGQSFKDGLNSAVYIPVRNLNESSTNIFGILDFNFSAPSIANDITVTTNGFAVLSNINPNQNSRINITEIDTINLTSILGSFEVQKNGALIGWSFYFDKSAHNYILAGSTNAEGLADGGGFDHYIASISADSTDGNKINWEKTYGGTGDEEAFAIAPTSDGGYIITGYTGFEGNSLINTIKVDNKGILNP